MTLQHLKKIRFCQNVIRFQHSSALNLEKQPKPFSDIPQAKKNISDNETAQTLDPARLYKFFEDRHKELGPIFKENLMGQNEVYTSSPADVETMYRNEPKWPSRPRLEVMSRSRELLNMNVGIVNVQGIVNGIECGSCSTSIF